MTQFARALTELNIDIRFANSPQAKGRVERAHLTLQDRLVKELRLQGVTTIDAANAFAPQFVADHIPTCLAQARELMDRWKLAVTTMVEDVAKQIENLRELTQGERKHVEEELLREVRLPELPASTSAYDLVNAITGAARQAEPSRRLDMESLAGTVLSRHVGWA
jgi:hypothetical protein